MKTLVDKTNLIHSFLWAGLVMIFIGICHATLTAVLILTHNESLFGIVVITILAAFIVEPTIKMLHLFFRKRLLWRYVFVRIRAEGGRINSSVIFASEITQYIPRMIWLRQILLFEKKGTITLVPDFVDMTSRKGGDLKNRYNALKMISALIGFGVYVLIII